MGWDGTQRDTGWIDITPDAGNQDVAAVTPRYRRIDNVVYLEGQIEKTTGSWAASSLVTLVSGANALPSDFRPTKVRSHVVAGSSTASFVKLVVNANGSIQMLTSATVPAYVALDIPPYLVD